VNTQSLQGELASFGLSPDDIESVLQTLLYAYVCDEIGYWGAVFDQKFIQDHFSHLDILVQLGLVDRTENIGAQRFTAFNCSATGNKIGAQLLSQRVSSNEAKLHKILSSFSPKLVGLWFRFRTSEEGGRAESKLGRGVRSWPLYWTSMVILAPSF